jgi:hypothetical protein
MAVRQVALPRRLDHLAKVLDERLDSIRHAIGPLP